MRNLFKNMPLPIEFAIVVAGAFGLSIIDSIEALLHRSNGPVHTEAGLWHTVGLQIVVFIVLGALLRLRGWNSERLGMQSHWMDGLHGVALAAGAYLIFVLTMIALSAGLPHQVEAAAKVQLMPKVLSPWVVAAVVLVNSFYEEFFATGYIITALKEKTGETIAINVSVVVRLSYHVVQGIVGVIGMIPIGLVFGYWYAKTGRLWPVMVAHAALNLVTLMPYVKL